MTERRERIPASEVKDSKRWNLPFWTEPKHLVHNEEHAQEEHEEVLVEDEEIEVEPLTAEQLESIRQEAFNEGLEQGLVEGRQKGEKLGHEEGYQEGLIQGKEEGRKLGFDSGFEQGEKQAFNNGSEENEKQSKKLETILASIQTQIAEQKKELTDNLPDIILAIAKAVITEELSQGSEHIITLVEQALNALPLDSGELKIDVNPQDLPFIEAAIEQGDFEGVAHGNENIEAGGCRVHTRYSTVDFTLSRRWADIEKQYRHQLQLSLNANDEDDETSQPTSLNEPDHEASSINDPQDGRDHNDDTAGMTEKREETKGSDETLNALSGEDNLSGDHETSADHPSPSDDTTEDSASEPPDQIANGIGSDACADENESLKHDPAQDDPNEP